MSILGKFLKKSTSLKVLDENRYAWLLGGNETATGLSVTDRNSLKLSAVFACVRILSFAEAQLPLFLLKENTDGWEKAKKHPLFRVLYLAPNDLMTSFQFRQVMATNRHLRGNALAFKSYYKDEIRSLWPIHPDNVVSIKLTPARELEYEIQDDSGSVKKYGRREIFHARGLSLDGFTGLSTINEARETVGMGLAMERHGAKLFKNGVKSSGIIEVPQGWGDVAFARLKSSFEESYAGIENSHKPIMLEEGAKYTATTMNNDDAQFIQNKKVTVLDICRFFGVPPHKVYELDKATFSNIEHQSLEYVIDSIMPHLVNMEQAYTTQLLNRLEQVDFRFWHNVDGLLRGDFKTRQEGLEIQRRNGIINADEWRELENRNRIPGGHVYKEAANIFGDQNKGKANAKQNT